MDLAPFGNKLFKYTVQFFVPAIVSSLTAIPMVLYRFCFVEECSSAIMPVLFLPDHISNVHILQIKASSSDHQFIFCFVVLFYSRASYHNEIPCSIIILVPNFV